MKKLLLTVLLLGVTRVARADFSISAIGQDIYDHTNITVAKGAYPAYFYDILRGDNKDLGGVLDHVVTYKDCLTLDMAWASAADREGILVGGPGIKIDGLLTLAAPGFVNYINSVVPESIQLWKPFFFGLSTGWNTDNGAFDFFFHTGIDFKFF